jgi:hypothetical protein
MANTNIPLGANSRERIGPKQSKFWTEENQQSQNLKICGGKLCDVNHSPTYTLGATVPRGPWRRGSAGVGKRAAEPRLAKVGA